MSNKLVLGTVQFGLDYGIANKAGQVPYSEVLRILDYAASHGIDCLDTAAAYGNSEEVLGNAISELKLHEKFKIITKTISGDDLNRSLERLKISQLYGCLIHGEDHFDCFPALLAAKDSGIVQNCGVSLDSQAGSPPEKHCDIIQLPYNILDRRFDHILKTGQYQIHARSAFLQGLLLMDTADIPEHLKALIPEIAKFEGIRHELKISKMEFYLRYNLSKPGISGVVIGVNTLEHLKMNIEIASQGPLPPDILKRIERLRTDLPEKLIRPKLWK